MFKKQKSKILVFLLMLGLLYGCKRQILDPLSPQTNLPSKVQLDKVKGFYENGRYKNQPKRTSSNGNERMTAADSARFKDFEPQWDKTEVELLPNNEKMLIVPVVRFLNVTYNQNIGFIRRLCIRVDVNDDFLEANIVELVGNLTFVKENHNDIFKNYKSASLSGFSGIIIIYGLNYDVQATRIYDASNFINNTLPIDIFKAVSCGVSVYSNGNTIITVNTCSGTATIFGGSGGGNGLPDFIEGDGSSGPYSPPIVTMPPCKDCPPPTVVVIPPVITTTTNPSPVVISPMPRPGMIYDTEFGWIDPMPHPGMVYDAEFGWIDPPPPTVDNGCSFCGNDWGDGIPRDADGNPIVPMTPDDELKVVEFKKIMRIYPKNLTKELEFARTLHNLKQRSPWVQKICDRIQVKLAIIPVVGNAGIRVNVLEVPGDGSTNINTSGVPEVKSSNDEAVFLEELIHVLQYLERNSVVRPNIDELTHMEFEAKLIGQMILGYDVASYMFDATTPEPQYIHDYRTWLDNINGEDLSVFGGSFTRNFSQLNFNRWIKQFAANPHIGYIRLQNANFVPTRLPTVLFFLGTW